MSGKDEYLKALRLALPRMRQAIHKELGMRAPETEDQWREALSGRDTKSIERFIRYWMDK